MLSIIIVNYNSTDNLKKCLASLSQHGKIGMEVFIVDNNSRDFDTKEIKSICSNVNIIINPKNQGFAKANNQAYKLSKGEIILLLNPDVEVLPGALDVMASYLSKHQDVAAVGPKLLNEQRQEANKGYYNKFPVLSDVFSCYFRLKKITAPLPDYAIEVAQIPGACLMVKREVIEKIGFLDERFFVWMEDVDFCLRIKQAGWKLMYLPQAEALHAGGATFKQMKRGEKGLMWARSNIRYFFKNKSAVEAGLFTLMFLPKIIQYLLLRMLNK